MAEWRLLTGWASDALKARLDRLGTRSPNFEAEEEQMTGEHGWHHYHSEAVIARETEGDARLARARVALASYQFSNPDIVVAHFDPESALLHRRHPARDQGARAALPLPRRRQQGP